MLVLNIQEVLVYGFKYGIKHILLADGGKNK